MDGIKKVREMYPDLLIYLFVISIPLAQPSTLLHLLGEDLRPIRPGIFPGDS